MSYAASKNKTLLDGRLCSGYWPYYKIGWISSVE